jgi:hypothetical protein
MPLIIQQLEGEDNLEGEDDPLPSAVDEHSEPA